MAETQRTGRGTKEHAVSHRHHPKALGVELANISASDLSLER